MLLSIVATPMTGGEMLVLEIAGKANGTIEIELYDQLAPNHVNRVKNLAESGAYDNVLFHRVIDGFMAQTGDVRYGKNDSQMSHMAGMGGSDEPDLKSEFSNTSFTRGVVGMARSSNPHSANSQFFIMFSDAPWLDGQYTVFGKVISGMDIVDLIKRGEGSGFSEPDYIVKAYTTQANDE